MKTYALKLDDELFAQVQNITKVTKSSFANFVREAISQKIASEKNSLSYRLNTLPECSETETDEILASLNALSDDDLAPVLRERVSID